MNTGLLKTVYTYAGAFSTGKYTVPFTFSKMSALWLNIDAIQYNFDGQIWTNPNPKWVNATEHFRLYISNLLILQWELVDFYSYFAHGMSKDDHQHEE